MEKIREFIIIICLALVLVFITAGGIQKNDEYQCKILVEQAAAYRGFFLSQAWKDTCDAHDIVIEQKFVR